MEIVTLEARDLFPYEEISVNLQNRGLVLVTGNNCDDDGFDSNGCGKTSLFRCLTWTLFDEPLSTQKGDEVIRLHPATKRPITGKTYGYADLLVDGKRVEVYRYRKHKEHKDKLMLFVDEKDITGPTNPETQRILNEILAMDVTTFLSVAMFPQGATGFASKTDAQQKAILECVLSLERFADAHKRIKAKKEEIEKQIQVSESALAALETRISDAQSTIRNLKAQDVQFNLEKEQKIKELEGKLKTLAASVPAVDDTLADQLKSLDSELTRLAKANEATSKTESLLAAKKQQLGQLQGQIKTHRMLIAQVPEVAPCLKPEFTVKYYQDSVAQMDRDLHKAAASIANVEEQIETLKRRIAKKEATTVCDRCGQSLSDEAKGKLFGNHEEDLKNQETKLEALEKIITTTKPIRESTYQLMQEAERWAKWDAEQSRKAEYEAAVQKFQAQADVLVADIGKLDGLLAKARQMVQDAISAQTKASTLRAQIVAQDAAVAAWARDKQAVERDLITTKASTSPYLSLMDAEQGKLGELEKKLSKEKTFKEHFSADLPYVDFWVRGFSNSGVKSLLLDTVVPYLNERANEYLRNLCGSSATIDFSTQTELKSGEKREKFNVTVAYTNGCNSVKGISGGELRRADVAIVLALGDLAASRAMAPIRIRLLDEPFEGLDSAGKERVVDLLKTIVSPRVGTLLVMTHDADLQSLFTNRIIIEKRKGVSRIVSG